MLEIYAIRNKNQCYIEITKSTNITTLRNDKNVIPSYNKEYFLFPPASQL